MNRPIRRRPARMLLATLFAVAAGAAIAQTQAGDVRPLPGEARLTISMGARNVAFPTKIAPLVRETIPFETNGHAVTEDGRQAMSRLQDGLLRQPAGSLIIVVYGENETLAFQRARAVRGELAERHSMDPARIVATGRKAQGHTGDQAVVDVYGADATRCGGCSGSTFRSISLDSATMALVTSTAEALPAAIAATEQKPQATRVASPAPTARSAPSPQRLPTAEPPPRPIMQAAAQQPQSAACPRPRIIIDDYYPGGPIVPCRPGR